MISPMSLSECFLDTYTGLTPWPASASEIA